VVAKTVADVLAHFTDAEFELLRVATDAQLARQPLTAEQGAIVAKWTALGGPEAVTAVQYSDELIAELGREYERTNAWLLSRKLVRDVQRPHTA
jgi:hypothetical protein